MAYSPNSGWSPLQAFLFGGLVLLLGAYLSHTVFLAYRASALWTKTRGTVTAGSLECHHGGRGGESCNAYIDYEYPADGEYYGASRVEVLQNDLFGGYSMEEEMNAKYREGAYLTVYYNPSRPSQSNLGPDAAPSPLFAALFIVAGLLLINSGRD